ncbi:unnamed protein product, partial [Acanthocheilonema viteae]
MMTAMVMMNYWYVDDDDHDDRRRCLSQFIFTTVTSFHITAYIFLSMILHKRSLLLNVDDAWKPQISMVSFNEPSIPHPAAGVDVTNFEREELLQRHISKSKLLSHGQSCSFSFLIFAILLQLEIVFVPVGATFSDKGKVEYPLVIDNRVRHHNWKRSIDPLIGAQQRRSSDYRSSSNSITRINVLNTTLLGNGIDFDKWKHAESISDNRPQHYHSEQFVLFTFIVVHNGQTKLFTTESAHIFIMELQPEEKIIVTCRASLLGLGEDMDVMWWKDNEFITTTNSSVLILNDQNLGLYRCVADVAIVSTDLLDSYLLSNRIKRSAEMPPGKVLSSAFIVKRAIPIHFTVHPKNLTVAHSSIFRLECATGGSSSQPITWYHNDTKILVEANRDNNIHIYTIEHHSILHLMGADLNDSGYYQCRSGSIFSDVAVVNVTFDEDGHSAEDLVTLTHLPSELLVPLGGSVILECLLYDPHSASSWHVVNEYGQPIH